MKRKVWPNYAISIASFSPCRRVNSHRCNFPFTLVIFPVINILLIRFNVYGVIIRVLLFQKRYPKRFEVKNNNLNNNNKGEQLESVRIKNIITKLPETHY